jgi:GTP-binding protein
LAASADNACMNASPTMPDSNPDAPPDFVEAGRKLFAGPSDFIWAADSLKALPPQSKVEIAFAGRSNVGKSSLVNALTGRNTLARTSHTPGRTQQLNFFTINDRFHLVDMPGYGYAAVEKEKVQAWTRLIHDYLRGRASLARVYLLIDARHGIKPVDETVLETLDKAAVSYQIVLTKADELKAGEIEKRMAETAGRIERRAAAFPEIMPTSSRTGGGIPELRAGIARLLADRGAA